VILVFLTKGYLTSPNCRRELTEAVRAKKRILVVREADANHGALTQDELSAERDGVPAADRFAVQTISLEEAIEWHRESHLKRAVLAEIMDTLLPDESAEQSPRPSEGRASSRPMSSARGASSEQASSRVPMMPRQLDDASPRPSRVYVHELYAECRGSSEEHLLAELSKRFGDVGIEVTTHREVDAPVVIVLCTGLFGLFPVVGELTSLLVAMDGTPIVPLFSTAQPFASYMNACPPELSRFGLFQMMFNKWPQTAELQCVAAAHAVVQPARLKPPTSFLRLLRQASPVVRERARVRDSIGERPLELEMKEGVGALAGLELDVEQRAQRTGATRRVSVQAEGEGRRRLSTNV